MSPQWQISAAELFEFIRPAAWTLSALVSACVLASARRQGLRPYAVAAWTLGTLFFPLITLPLYLIARSILRRRARAQTAAAAQTVSAAQPRAHTVAASPKLRYVLPLLYLLAVMSFIAIFFYRDYRSLDAHLWRANNAKLRGPHSKVIAEYRAALRLEDDPHTRKLLAIELAADGLNEEAIEEFRVAERGGEPDPLIPYYLGTALFSLGREAEAATEYKRFLGGSPCTDVLPDVNCSTARARLPTLQAR